LENIFKPQIFEYVKQYYANQGMGSEDKAAPVQDVKPSTETADEEMKKENGDGGEEEEKEGADQLDEWEGDELKHCNDMLYKICLQNQSET
jgi:hypothetical protein